MSMEESKFMNSVFSDNECRLSLTRTKSTSIPNQINSQQSLQTLANLDDQKLQQKESCRVFHNHNIESFESQDTSLDYVSVQVFSNKILKQLESQIYDQRNKEKEGVNQMCQLKSELDSFIGLLQKVKPPQEEIQFKQNLSVIVSTDESQTSKQSPAQDYYSFTNQTDRTLRTSRIPSEQQNQEDQQIEQENSQFQKMVGQKREIIQEGFKRCLQALLQICKKYNLSEAIPWIDKLTAIQIIIIQQATKVDKCIQVLELNEQKFIPQIHALKECLSQQEKELDLLHKQNQQKAKYQYSLENELKNLYQEQSSERQQILEMQQKNFQLKNLILVANRQYEDLLLKLSLNEKKLQQQQATYQEQTTQLLKSNKVLRNVIMTSGDEKAEQIVKVLLSVIGKDQNQSQKLENDASTRQKSEGQARQKSDSQGRTTKENIKDLKKKNPIVSKASFYCENQQRSPLSTLRNKMSEFHSAKKSQNRSLHPR